MKLAMLLDTSVPRYSKPKYELEQYRTPPEVAIVMGTEALKGLHNARLHFVDLGAGTGMLSYTLAILGAYHVVGIEVDADALIDSLGSPLWDTLASIDLVCADVRYLPLRYSQYVVVMNPPFGRVQRGLDRVFMNAALSLKPLRIVLVHVYNTEFLKVLRTRFKEYGYELKQVEGRYRIHLPPMYPSHYKRVHHVDVMLLVGEPSHGED